jgi:hypothetical protein
MRTVVLGPRPPELDALIARRRSLGLDTHDEVWKGEHQELLIVSPESRSVTWLTLEKDQYEQVIESRLLGPESALLVDRIDWPADV